MPFALITLFKGGGCGHYHIAVLVPMFRLGDASPKQDCQIVKHVIKITSAL